MRARLIVRDPDADVYELTDDHGDQLVYDLGPGGSCPDIGCIRARRDRFDQILSELKNEIGRAVSCLHIAAEIRGTTIGYDRNMMVVHVHVPRPHADEDRAWIDISAGRVK